MSARSWLARVQAIFTGARDEGRLREEAAAHMEELAADYERQGFSAQDARAAAQREFGNFTAIQEAHREQRRPPFLDPLAQDMRYAFRQLRAKPVFAATAILTLALGIGANTAIFRVLDAVALRLLPVKHPGQLVSLALRQNNKRGDVNVYTMSYPLFRELVARQRSLAGLISSSAVALAEETGPLQVRLATGDYFRVLEVDAAIGRTLLPDDDRPNAPPVCVISYGYWKRAFGGEASVLGRTIRINDAVTVIVGVAPRGFFGERVGSAPDLWLPMNLQPLVSPDHANWLTSRGQASIAPIARLKPGVPLSAAEAELSALYSELHDLSPHGRADSYSVDLEPAGKGLGKLRGDFARPLEILMAIAGLVLLMACCNLATLLLTRASSRTHEMGVRRALGAGRGRLLRQLLTESAILAGAGAALGFALASWGSKALVEIASTGQGWRLDLAPDGRLLAFTAAISIAAVFVFGVGPAVLATRVDAHTSLQGNRRASESRPAMTLSRVFVAAQVAVSLMLVTGAALLAHSFHNLTAQDFGYRQDGLLLVQFKIDRALMTLRDPARLRPLFERLNALPGVRTAALGGPGPLAPMQSLARLSAADSSVSGVDGLQAAVSPRYFETMKISILAGRALSDEDRAETPPVTVLSETAARRLFGGANPVGRLIAYDTGKEMRVVGVAHDVRANSPREDFLPIAYLPLMQMSKILLMTAVLRTSAEPASVAGEVKDAVRDLLPGIKIESAMPLKEVLDGMMVRERMVAQLSAAFGLLALVLGSAGLYGVIAYSVERRTQELGIRLALGAARVQVTAMLVKEVARLLCIGLALGLCGTLALAGLLRSALFGLTPHDPATLGAAAGLLSLAGLTAAYLPARRASRLDPMVALKEE